VLDLCDVGMINEQLLQMMQKRQIHETCSSKFCC